jgi:acetoin utilization protein AcuC
VKPALANQAHCSRLAGASNAARSTALVSNPVFRNEAFGSHHPLSIHRHGKVLDLVEILGWLDPRQYQECPMVPEPQLARFHGRRYIEALRSASASGKVSVEAREQFGFGTLENPVFPGLFERAAATVGGSILAAELALSGTVAFHPAGGTHHGRRDRASGFCYFNDPAFAIGTLLDGGASRVMYVDLDAHHGDGVQDIWSGDARVMTVSIHERDRWPHSGAVNDRGAGQARNLPVPPGFNDSELGWLMANVVSPLQTGFAPDALVITCGADALEGDPLSRMALSNVALWEAVESLLSYCPAAVVLGGGGYNPWTVVRCWAGLWGRLCGQEFPTRLPEAAHSLLADCECDLLDEEDIEPAWLTTLADQPNTGPVRAEVRQLAGLVLN